TARGAARRDAPGRPDPPRLLPGREAPSPDSAAAEGPGGIETAVLAGVAGTRIRAGREPCLGGFRHRLRRAERVRGARRLAGTVPATDEIPDVDLAFPLDGDRPLRLADELVGQELHRRPGDLDPAGCSARFHPARGVHRVPPEVVQEPL